MNIEVLLGKVLLGVVISPENDRIEFICKYGDRYAMYHHQDCCEQVLIKEIAGDMADLYKAGLPITLAEKRTNDTDQAGTDGADSFRWTFYKLGTVHGCVTITWLGTSNGYYSEEVEFEQIP